MSGPREVAVVGGGLAGAAAAGLLARGGARVVLHEREAGPAHKICGEFLSVEARALLARLGLDLGRLGAAPIDRLRLVAGARVAEVALPFVAMGLSRRRLDEALLEAAAAAGAVVARGAAVQVGADRAMPGAGRPAALLLATGKHAMRALPRDTAGCEQGLVGFKLHWRLPPAARAELAGRIDVALFRGGYAGLQLVEGGVGNLCLLVAKPALARAGGWEGLLARLLATAHLGRLLGDAEPLWPRPLAVSRVPYGFLHRARAGDDPQLYRLGDQAAVIPSFSGDGMAIALHSAAAAAGTLLAGGNAPAYHASLARRLAPQMRAAMRLQRLGLSGIAGPPLVAALARLPALARWAARATRVPGYDLSP